MIRGTLIGGATLLSALLCTSALPAAPAPARAAAPAMDIPPIAFTERKLKNGLRVIAIRDTSTPNVMTSMWYEVGSKHDPEGRSGFAHLFEHILSRKTVNMPYNAINKMVDDVGGTRNASTWYDRTNYYETVPAEYLERMLWTHAERMARPVIDKEVFETERNVVKEELRQRVLAPPYGRLFNFAIGENVYNIMPHRRPTIGSIAGSQLGDARGRPRLPRSLLRARHRDPGRRRQFRPGQAQCVGRPLFRPDPEPAQQALAGDHDQGQADHRADASPRPAPTFRCQSSAPRISCPAKRNRDMAALEVLDAILSAGQHNRLDTALVKTGLAAGVGTNFNDTEEESYLAAYAILAGGKTPDSVAPELDKVIASLRATGPTADEVFEARNELLSAALSARETFSDRAFELGERLVRTGDPHFADERLARIAKVTPADVKRVAALYLNPSHELGFRYVQGDGDPKGWANPTPMPKFRVVPPRPRQGEPAASRGRARPACRVPATRCRWSCRRRPTRHLANGIRVIAVRTGDTPLASMTDPGPRGRCDRSARQGGPGEPRRGDRRQGHADAQRRADRHRTREAGCQLFGPGRPGRDLSVGHGSDRQPRRGRGDPRRHRAQRLIPRRRLRPRAQARARRPGRGGKGSWLARLNAGAAGGLRRRAVRHRPVRHAGQPGGYDPRRPARLSQSVVAARAQSQLSSAAGSIRPPPSRFPSRFWVTGRLREQRHSCLPRSPAPSAPGARWSSIYPGPARRRSMPLSRGLKRSDPEFYDAAVANSALGGSSTGRLFVEIRVKRALELRRLQQPRLAPRPRHAGRQRADQE